LIVFVYLNALYSVFGLLYYAVSKWHGDASVDEFDRSNLSSHSGLDDLPYASERDPRQSFEVGISYFLSAVCVINMLKRYIDFFSPFTSYVHCVSKKSM